MNPHHEALIFTRARIAVARAWGLRGSHPRGEICQCNGPGGVCRDGSPGAHPLHDQPSLTATKDPATVSAWAVDHPGENVLALTGERSRLLGLEFASGTVRSRREFDWGCLPPTVTTRSPGGSEIALFRWVRPPLVGPDILGEGVRVLGEGAWTPVPGSILPDGLVTWAARPNGGFADLPQRWRDAIREAQAGTPNIRVFARA